ncbi:hypothetical protein V5N11_010519 [Cardamine amara subsp. amara]|uniref:RNase H type-1 domain-containing protein n=1 Tax=Cardamine amara subsp. amara TaxID=228776 RepID=A0ABD1AQ31_CARAN
MAEAMAVFQALQRAKEMNITTLTLASDSQKLIKALNQDIHLMEIHGIQHDILDLSSTFISVIFVYIPRNLNRDADALAKAALRNLVTEPV